MSGLPLVVQVTCMQYNGQTNAELGIEGIIIRITIGKA